MNGNPSTLPATGTFTVDPNETFSKILYNATNTGTTQQNFITATADQNKLTWKGTLQLVAGNYNAYAVIYTKAGGNTLSVLGPKPPLPPYNVDVK
jgi:hypothetical protein